MCDLRILSQNLEQTEEIARAVADKLKSGDFVTLRGDLGAGKTAFARSIVRRLGDDSASSPTFSIVHEYESVLPVFHFDLYRLSGIDDLDAIGYEEYIARNGIILMEWPERIESYLPKERIEICITKKESTNENEINVKSALRRDEI